jgi:hypothetical protein
MLFLGIFAPEMGGSKFMAEIYKPNKGYAWLVAGIFLLISGGRLIYTGGNAIMLSSSVDSWAEGKAIVKSFAVKPLYVKTKQTGNYIVATYTYGFSGNQLVGNHVALDPTFAGSGEKLLKAKRLLAKAVEEKSNLPVFIDPQNPENAVLFKARPLTGYFYAGFGAFLVVSALALLAVFFHFWKQAAIIESLQALYPQQPWRWQKKWQSFKMRAEPAWEKLLPLIVFSLAFFCVTLVFVALIIVYPEPGSAGLFAAGFLLLLNLFFAFLLVKKVNGEKWAAAVEFEASSYPAVPGKPWNFKLLVSKPDDLEVVSGLKIYLKKCESTGLAIQPRTHAGSRFADSIEEKEFVEDGHTCFLLQPDLQVNEGELQFRVVADIPAKAENTSCVSEASVHWQVILLFARLGKEYIETFEIPVYSEESYDQPHINDKF